MTEEEPVNESGSEPGESESLSGNAAAASASSEAGPPVDARLEGKPTRRDLLAQATLGLGACAALGVGGVVGAAVVGTPLRKGESTALWCPLGRVKDFTEGPRKLPVRAPGRDAWRRFESRSLGRVVVVKQGEELNVFSAACPHNGCDVAVGEGASDLVCPCHKSTFGLDGERLDGVAPRGLDPLATRVRKGQLEVQFQRFALGTSKREPV